MILSELALLALSVAIPLQAGGGNALEGVVVNGTQNGVPVAGAEVIVRASKDNTFQPVARTVSGPDGRFFLNNLPTDQGLVFLPGANHQGIHYPGPRLLLESGQPTTQVTLTVHDTVASPNPLRATLHEITIKVEPGFLEIVESLEIENPTLSTYVGQPDDHRYLATLRLSIPNGFERVTFFKEFNGRRFKIGDKGLVTDIPWTPGKRELKFMYKLPVEEIGRIFERTVDIPCVRVRVRVQDEKNETVECDSPLKPGSEKNAFLFESADQPWPAGEKIRLTFRLPNPWIVNARWIGLAMLGLLVLFTLATTRIREQLRRGRHAVQGRPRNASGEGVVPATQDPLAATGHRGCSTSH